jgi:lipopolysaccharide export system permease protein
MHVLDRYIAGRFLRALVFSLLVFIAIYVIVDLVEHLDTFVDARASADQVFRYYLNYVPAIIVLTLPIAVLMASLFTVGGLSKSNELMAMKSVGLSLWRISTPILIIGLLLSGMLLVFAEWVVPQTDQERSDILKYEIEGQQEDRKTIAYHVYRQGADGRIFRLERYDLVNKRGYGVLVQRIEDSRLIWTVKANEVQWQDSAWMLRGGEERTFESDEWVPFDSLLKPEWTVTPADFSQRDKHPENMGYLELLEFVNIKERSGQDASKERFRLQFKLALPLMCFIIIMVGVPIASSPKRAGVALSFGIAAGIAIVYIFLLRIMESLGKSGDVPPLVAAWAMNIVFIIVGLSLFAAARK